MTELNPNQQQYDLIQGNIPYAPILPNQFPNYGVSDQTIDYNFQIRNKPTFSRNLVANYHDYGNEYKAGKDEL